MFGYRRTRPRLPGVSSLNGPFVASSFCGSIKQAFVMSPVNWPYTTIDPRRLYGESNWQE